MNRRQLIVKGIKNLTPKWFILLLAMLGSIMVGTLFHENTHIVQNDLSVVCWDYSDKTIAFATNKEYFEDNFYNSNGITQESQVAKHFSIYYMEGLLVGILITLSITIYNGWIRNEKDEWD